MYSPPYVTKILAILLLVVFVYSPVFAIDNLPDIGAAVDTVMSVEEENKLGVEFMRSVRANLNLIQDPISNEYIQNLGERLASQIDSGGQSFSFFIVNDNSINAFAGPGGYIGVHTGLILASQSEDELASVVAHEIAHVTQRHLVRTLSASTNMTIPAMAAIIAAILLGQGNAQITEAVIASTIAGTTQTQLHFSRIHEQEADRVGIEMMAKSGFDPIAMPYFFETLQKSHRYADGNIPEFILTHPVTSSRIADSKGRAEQYKRVQRLPEQSINYELVKTRIYLLSKDKNHDPVAQLDLDKAPDKNSHFANRYQYVLELDPKQHYQEARRAIQELIRDDNERVPYIITQADIETANEHWEAACDILKRGNLIYPNNVSITLAYASSLIKNQRSKDAMQLLEQRLRAPSSPVDYYKLYAQAAQTAGFQSEAFESLGEYYYRLGNYHSAIKQFEYSLKENNNNNNNKFRELKLKARIQEIKAQVLNNQPDKDSTTEKRASSEKTGMSRMDYVSRI
jgi:predicted Zn-dependent protease